MRYLAILAALALGACTTAADGTKTINPATVAEAQRIAAVICGYVPTVDEITKLGTAASGSTVAVSYQAQGSAIAQAACAFVTAREGAAMAAAAKPAGG